MNRKQRESNRQNARYLYDNSFVCTECGERGRHFIPSQYGIFADFWTCSKFYDPVTKRRLENYELD